MGEKSQRARLDGQDWGDICARLLDFALSRCGKHAEAQAKDLVQSAITRVFTGRSQWDSEKEPDLVRYLMSVVNSLRANERTSRAAQTSMTMSEGKGKRAAARVADDQAWDEEKAAEGDLFSRRLTLLRQRMAGDPPVLQYLDALGRGEESAQEICAGLGWPAERLKAVRRRMLRAAALVARDLGGLEDEEALVASGNEDAHETEREQDEMELSL